MYIFPRAHSTELLLIGLGQTYSLVPVIEDRVILAHKDIPKYPLGSMRDVHTHQGKEAGSPGLDYKFLPRDRQRLSADRELYVGHGVNLRAVDQVLSPKTSGEST